MIRDVPRPMDAHQASRATQLLLQLLNREDGYERAREIIDDTPAGSLLDIAFLHQVLRACSPMSRPSLMMAIRHFQEWSDFSSGAERHDGTEDK